MSAGRGRAVRPCQSHCTTQQTLRIPRCPGGAEAAAPSNVAEPAPPSPGAQTSRGLRGEGGGRGGPGGAPVFQRRPSPAWRKVVVPAAFRLPTRPGETASAALQAFKLPFYLNLCLRIQAEKGPFQSQFLLYGLTGSTWGGPWKYRAAAGAPEGHVGGVGPGCSGRESPPPAREPPLRVPDPDRALSPTLSPDPSPGLDPDSQAQAQP